MYYIKKIEINLSYDILHYLRIRQFRCHMV